MGEKQAEVTEIGFRDGLPLSMEEVFDRARVVMQAKVIRNDSKTLFVKPIKIWKGEKEAPTEIHFKSAVGAERYQLNKEYLFFLTEPLSHGFMLNAYNNPIGADSIKHKQYLDKLEYVKFLEHGHDD